MQTTKTQMLCIPGEKICLADDVTIPGFGTYRDEDGIYASVAGYLTNKKENGKMTLSIEKIGSKERAVPASGDIVTCLVISTQTNIAVCNIKCVNEVVLKQPFKAMIKRDEIRVQDKEITDISKYCLAGDIIIGRIIGLGDNGRYIVSVAEPGLGVVQKNNQ